MTCLLHLCDSAGAIHSYVTIGERQAHRDRGAFPFAAGDVEPAAVAFDDVLDDGEAEAGTAGRAATARIDPIEAPRQMRDVLGVDAFAAIPDREHDEARVTAYDREIDLGIGRAVLERVVD